MKTTILLCATLALFAIMAFIACDSHNNRSASAPQNINSDTTHPGAVAVATNRGMELFQQRCQACHGLSGNYRNNNAANLQVSVADSLTIINTIKNGKGAMPMFASIFADSDLAQLALYVKFLRAK